MGTGPNMARVQAFLDGAYLPLEECRISPLDRGFIFGDGVYELLPVYHGKPFYLSRHLSRLERNLLATHIRNPYSKGEWSTIVETLVQRSEGKELAIYIQVTRGVAPRDHIFPEGMHATVFAMANPLPEVPREQLENGVALITVDDVRWRRCDIKTISLQANILAKQDACRAAAVEAVMVRDGVALEGAASNLFIVRNGEVFTHPEDHLILPGITRDLILELLDELEVKYVEQAIPEAWLCSSDEVWISSSAKEILAATKINDQTIGEGVPGEIWKRVYALYQRKKHA